MMHGNRARRHKHAILSSPFFIAALIAAFAFAAHAAWEIYVKDRTAADRLAQAQANLSRLQAQQGSLTEKIQYLSTDRGVEAELREKYRAVKDGESVAVIVDAPEASGSAATSTPSQSWLGSFLQLFGF